MKLSKEGKTYTLIFNEDEIPPGRKVENWCGVSALHWISIESGQPHSQNEIADAICFDSNEGTSGDQFLWGIQAIGLYSSPWMQLTLEQCQKLLDTKLCQIAVNWTHGDDSDYNHYSSLAAVDGLVVLYDTQVDGALFILRSKDFAERWHYGDPGHVAPGERNWAVIITKTPEDFQQLLRDTPT